MAVIAAIFSDHFLFALLFVSFFSLFLFFSFFFFFFLSLFFLFSFFVFYGLGDFFLELQGMVDHLLHISSWMFLPLKVAYLL